MFWSISFRVTSLALGQSYDCPGASEASLNDMGKSIPGSWRTCNINTTIERKIRPCVYIMGYILYVRICLALYCLHVCINSSWCIHTIHLLYILPGCSINIGTIALLYVRYNMDIVLLCFVLFCWGYINSLCGFVYRLNPYSSELHHWYWGNPVPVDELNRPSHSRTEQTYIACILMVLLPDT